MAETRSSSIAAQTLRVVATSPERLELEATWEPGGKPPPVHWHPTQHEHFEVLEGELTVELSGEHVPRARRRRDARRATPHRAPDVERAATPGPGRHGSSRRPCAPRRCSARMAGASKLKQGAMILRHRDEFRLGDSPD